jgi:hypothetical protein
MPFRSERTHAKDAKADKFQPPPSREPNSAGKAEMKILLPIFTFAALATFA